MSQIIKLCDHKTTEIQYIYHLSDIHIVKRDRETEYVDVFQCVQKRLTKATSNAWWAPFHPS